MRRVNRLGMMGMIILGIISGCTPTKQKPEGQQEQVKPDEGVGQKQSTKLEEIRISKGVVSKRELLRRTDRGFRKWEWWFWNVPEAYDPSSEGFIILTSNLSIEVLEYWISHGAAEPATNKTEWREEYDAAGRMVMRTTYSDEHGFNYERFTYDSMGRLAEAERRVSVQDTGFDSAKVWSKYSYKLEYFTRTDGEPGIYRLATDFNGKPFKLDRERELVLGWEYMYDPDVGEPTTLSIEYANRRLSIVTRDFGDGDKQTISYQYDSDNRISKTIETALGSSSPLFTSEYEHDGQGRLTKASTWEHRTNKQGRIRSFSDYDERGNWKRVVTRLDGEINSIVIRHLKYR